MHLLTATEFRRLAASVQDAPASAMPPGAEHRRSPRADCKLDGLILPVQLLASGTMHQVTIRDLSARGISFLYHCRWERGQEFVIRIEGTPAPIFILCMVAHCREAGRNLYRLGAEFVCVLGEDPTTVGGEAMAAAQRNMRAGNPIFNH